MGITIHFKGTLRSADALESVLAIVRQFATQQVWPLEEAGELSGVLSRINLETQDWESAGPVKGVILKPSENCEFVRLLFDEKLYVQDWVKTQFAGPQIHMEIVQLFRLIEPHFETLRIYDEAEYWKSKDEQKLRRLMGAIDEALDMLGKEIEDQD